MLNICSYNCILFLPNNSTRTIASSVTKPLKNPYIEMTETYSVYEWQNGIKNMVIPLRKTEVLQTDKQLTQLLSDNQPQQKWPITFEMADKYKQIE